MKGLCLPPTDKINVQLRKLPTCLCMGGFYAPPYKNKSMSKDKRIYEQLRKFLNRLPRNFKVTEQGFNPDIITIFRKEMQKLKNKKINFEETKDKLATEKEEETLKSLTIQLASIGSVASLRALETYEKQAPERIREWVQLSIVQCRIKVEQDLSDESVAYITTGLGGKDDKIRYYVATKSTEQLTPKHVQFAREEFHDLSKEWSSELETVENMENFLLFKMLIPVNAAIPDMLLEGIKRCGFLSAQFWLNNMQKPTYKDLKKWIEMVDSKSELPRNEN